MKESDEATYQHHIDRHLLLQTQHIVMAKYHKKRANILKERQTNLSYYRITKIGFKKCR